MKITQVLKLQTYAFPNNDTVNYWIHLHIVGKNTGKFILAYV